MFYPLNNQLIIRESNRCISDENNGQSLPYGASTLFYRRFSKW